MFCLDWFQFFFLFSVLKYLKYFVFPTLLLIVRVVKMGVLRWVKGARGIRTLLFALAMSFSAIFNICFLLFLVMFIYAIFWDVCFFMNVKQKYKLDETFNFGTFLKSFLLLFQMCTSAGLDRILAVIMDETEYDKTSEIMTVVVTELPSFT